MPASAKPLPSPVARPRLLPAWGWALAAVLAAQVGLAALVPVLPEEAYHWNFARHPDWSYYDHPPMIAWAIAVGRSLLGDVPLGIRLVPLLFALGSTWLLARLARRLYGASAALAAVLLCALQPAAFFVGGWGFPDAPLLFFWSLTLTWVWCALETRRAGWWLAAGAALGAAMLSKYTAAFLVPSVLLYLLFSARDRRWLATPWPYLAGVCSLLVFSPVFYWNWAHDWVSFRFQSSARFAAADAVSLRDGLQSVAEQWAFMLPLTLPLAVVALARCARSARPADRFLFWSFVPMTGFFFVLGWTPSFHVLWPLPAYLGLTVAMAGAAAEVPGRVADFYRRRWAWLAGLAVVCVFVVGLHMAYVLPGVPPLRETYGWDVAAARARDLRATLPAGSFYLAAGGRPYPPASQLAFHLNAPAEVYAQNLIGGEALQYRLWADPARLAGRDAVVVVEGGDRSGQVWRVLRAHFTTVKPAGDLLVPVGHFAALRRPPLRFTLYRAYGYRQGPGPLARN